MAAFVRTGLTSNFIDRPNDARQWLGDATAGGSEDSRKAFNKVMRNPDFVITGTTDSNTAVLNAGAAQSYALKLVSEGKVSFPNGFDRNIDIVCYTKDTSGLNFQSFRQTVRGGATNPTLVNGVSNLGPNSGGRITFATAAATAADAYNGFSITSVATAAGRYAAALPKARRVILENLNLSEISTATLADRKQINLNAIALSTGVIEIGLRKMSDGTNVAPADTDVLYVEFDVLPVESPELVIETAATPDEVLIGALGQSATAITWTIEVYVGPLRPNT